MLEAGQAKEAREASKVIIGGELKGYAGYLSAASQSGTRINHLWFWYQPCRNNCTHGTAPLLQYFAGGPGSGVVGPAFTEMGNYFAASDGSLQERCHSWCLDNDCFFVDNPIQAGLSYQVDVNGSAVPLEQTEWADSVEGTKQQLIVLLQLFELFPELAPAPFWITGESYAGNYCPHFAKAVLEHNALRKWDKKTTKINLKGLSVGDPCLGWSVQTEHYGSALWSMGLVAADERAQIDTIFEKARAELKNKDCPAFFEHWDSFWNDDGTHPEFLYEKFTGTGAPDIFLVGGGRAAQGNHYKFLAAHTAEMKFAGTPAAEKADDGDSLSKWLTKKRKAIYKYYVESGDFCMESAPIYFQDLLPSGIDINIYSSNLDALLGPHTTEPGIDMGLEAATLKERFYSHNKTIWKRSEDSPQPVGYGRCMAGGADNRFCYTLIRNAGHETPMFEAAGAYDMTKRFLLGKPFDDSYYDAESPQCQPQQTAFEALIAGYKIFA